MLICLNLQGTPLLYSLVSVSFPWHFKTSLISNYKDTSGHSKTRLISHCTRDNWQQDEITIKGWSLWNPINIGVFDQGLNITYISIRQDVFSFIQQHNIEQMLFYLPKIAHLSLHAMSDKTYEEYRPDTTLIYSIRWCI